MFHLAFNRFRWVMTILAIFGNFDGTWMVLMADQLPEHAKYMQTPFPDSMDEHVNLAHAGVDTNEVW